MSMSKKVSNPLTRITGIFKRQRLSFFKGSISFFSLSINELQKLISEGIDVNQKDKLGRTPLMYLAASNDDAEVIRAILRAGARVNDTDIDDKTALTMAAKYNSNPEIIEALIEAGADVNHANIKKRTPLMYAALSNPNPEVIKLLLDYGADGTKKDARRYTAFDHLKKGYNSTLRKTEAFNLLKEAAIKPFRPRRQDW